MREIDRDPGWQQFNELSNKDGLTSIEVDFGVSLKVIYFELPATAVGIEAVFIGDDMSLFEISGLKGFDWDELAYQVEESVRNARD